MLAKSRINGDVVISGILALICLYVFIGGFEYRLNSRMLPQVIAFATFFACVGNLFRLLRVRPSIPSAKPTEATVDGSIGKTGGEKKPASLMTFLSSGHVQISLLAVMYIVLFQPLGFVLCTLSVLGGVPYILKSRRHVVIWSLAVTATLFFYYVFKLVFFVQLPQGLLTFM